MIAGEDRGVSLRKARRQKQALTFREVVLHWARMNGRTGSRDATLDVAARLAVCRQHRTRCRRNHLAGR
jgi:hypothetical protein